MTGWMVMLIILGVMGALGLGTCVVCVAVAHNAVENAGAPGAVPSASPIGAQPELSLADAISAAMGACTKLEKAGVAKTASCKPGNASGHCLNSTSTSCVTEGVALFTPVGLFPTDDARIFCSRTEAEYRKHAESLSVEEADVAPDNYPNLSATSAKTRLTVSVGTTDANPDKWDDCMEKRKSVPACIKLYPKQYAAFHALFDAAKAAIDAPP